MHGFDVKPDEGKEDWRVEIRADATISYDIYIKYGFDSTPGEFNYDVLIRNIKQKTFTLRSDLFDENKFIMGLKFNSWDHINDGKLSQTLTISYSFTHVLLRWVLPLVISFLILVGWGVYFFTCRQASRNQKTDLDQRVNLI